MESKTIGSNWNNIWAIKKPFLEWEKFSSQISKHIHYFDCKQCYKLKTLGLVKQINLVLGLTQENSVENSVQTCLSYILELMFCALLF